MSDASGLLHRWRLVGTATRDRRLSSADVAALWAVCERADKSGACWPGLDTIAHDARIHRRTAIRAIEELCRYGYLVRESGGPGRANRYVLSSGEPVTPTSDEPVTTTRDGVVTPTRDNPVPEGVTDLSFQGVTGSPPEPAFTSNPLTEPTKSADARDEEVSTWKTAVALLTKSGRQEAGAKAIVGRIRKILKNDDETLRELVAIAARDEKVDPAAWLLGAATKRAKTPRLPRKPIARASAAEAEASADAALARLEVARHA